MLKNHKPGYLYAIHAYGTNLVKIGITGGSVEERMRQLSTGSPFLLQPLAIMRVLDMGLAEKYLHEKFSYRQFNNEWFTFTMDELHTVLYPAMDEVGEDAGVPGYFITQTRINKFNQYVKKLPSVKLVDINSW